MEERGFMGEAKEWAVVLFFLCLLEVGIACSLYCVLPLFY